MKDKALVVDPIKKSEDSLLRLQSEFGDVHMDSIKQLKEIAAIVKEEQNKIKQMSGTKNNKKNTKKYLVLNKKEELDYILKVRKFEDCSSITSLKRSSASHWTKDCWGEKLGKIVDNGDTISLSLSGHGLIVKLEYSQLEELYALIRGWFLEIYKEELKFVEDADASLVAAAPATSTSSFTAYNSKDETLVMDKHVLAVIQQLKDRSIAGRNKYNTNLERQDLSIQDWLQHAQEEALDFANYLQVLKEKFQ